MYTVLTLVFDDPRKVPHDIISQIFANIAEGKTLGKIGDTLYSAHPETPSWEDAGERARIEFCLQ